MRLLLLLVSCLGLLGCMERVATNAASRIAPAAGKGNTAGDSSSHTVPPTPAAGATAAIQHGKVLLTPENTSIQFVGTHVGEKPDPRAGGFEKFTGEARLERKTLQSVKVDIETGSLWTEFNKLTEHLHSPDFFDTRQYPKATFESTEIAPGAAEGEYTIRGKLTLMGVTKEISFPAQVAVTDQALSLKADFQIDRAEFGMDKLTDRVEKNVSLSVVIGQPTRPRKEKSAT